MGRTHTDREYDAKLDELRQRLVHMAARVEAMVEAAVRALVGHDAALARATMEIDREIDRCELESDELCMLVLARCQPIASDLRFLTTALKMVTDLERMGDLAVNLCERVIDLDDYPPRDYDLVPKMATLAIAMMHDAVRAFVDRDAELARAVLARDDEVDELYHRVFRANLARMGHESAELVHRGIHVQSVAKYLERFADHATNLAEQAIFMVAGMDVRHLDKVPRG